MNESLKNKISQLANQLHAEVIEIRRHLHAHPELSFQEYETAKFICSKLDEYGITYQAGIVKTGIVAHIKGNNPEKKCIALRADTDALAIKEENKVSYCSKNEGVMHACGHDVHTASLLGTVKILNQLKNDFEGTVKIIFQPGEEKAPGGASLMIKEGVLINPDAQLIFGQHVFPNMETGKVGFRSGMYMASTDEIYLTIKGKGGHAAMPAEYVNPVLVGAAIIAALHNVFMNPETKNIPDVPTVLAFGKFIGNGTTNVIPTEVTISGTMRTMDENWRAEAKALIKKIATEKAKSMNAECDVRIQDGYPFLVNDEKITAAAKKNAQEFLGKDNVEDLPLRMTAEDFAFYTQHIPGCFYRLGTGNKAKGITAGVHTSTFDIDEDALKTGCGLMAWLAICELNAK
jgi:amidohydrolase